MDITNINTLGALKSSSYQSKTIKEELRDNLIIRLQSGQPVFEGIKGYEETVIPQVQSALLSNHNMIFLGLRGQAKTRMARLMLQLLDEYIPYIAGTDLKDDPIIPISTQGKKIVNELGDDTPIAWLSREERYSEKLATPDVTVADLIGDVDPIKAANLRLSYADENVIHYGMIPRANRGLFVINELPDLQARIQVGLFNILEEGDIQIRGFNLRLPLDVQFIFTANPEDYTNRGSIVTPLKDRIESQILTHYPTSREIAKEITQQEARVKQAQQEKIHTPELLKDLIEQLAFEARNSEYVDQKSGVSARLTISAFENLHSIAERRLLINQEDKTVVRIADLYGIIPSITGKIELVYEGELEGISNVAQYLIGKAIRTVFLEHFPDPEQDKKSKEKSSRYVDVMTWFAKGNEIDILQNDNQSTYVEAIQKVDGLQNLVNEMFPDLQENEKLVYMEFVLHGLAELSQISKLKIKTGNQFKDLMSSMIDFENMEFDEDELK